MKKKFILNRIVVNYNFAIQSTIYSTAKLIQSVFFFCAKRVEIINFFVASCPLPFPYLYISVNIINWKCTRRAIRESGAASNYVLCDGNIRMGFECKQHILLNL